MSLKKPALALIALAILAAATPAAAESDQEKQEKALKAREMLNMRDGGHAAHRRPADDPSEGFHGVFYGFLPCADCNGIKTTLSLKHKNNYLIVTQPARESSREYYEKGKYLWDEDSQTVTLTPRKGGTQTKRYRIENDSTLVQLNSDGSRITGGDADRYVLRRSDTVKSREVHIH